MKLAIKDITMTSLELVEYINEIRKSDEAELRHSDFLTKVPKVLNGVERNFSSYYKASNGKKNPCYKFPKREACLMAMSYSYELQAKVFDRMTELENQVKDKQIAIQDKRSAHHPMMDALIEHKEELGQDVKTHDFINENLLCNWAVTGVHASIKEGELTINDAQLLAYVRRTNESLIMAGVAYSERKRLLAYKAENKRIKINKLLAKD